MARVQITLDWDAIKRDPVEFAEQLLRAPDGSLVFLAASDQCDCSDSAAHYQRISGQVIVTQRYSPQPL